MKNVLKILPFILLFLFVNTCKKNPAEWADYPIKTKDGPIETEIREGKLDLVDESTIHESELKVVTFASSANINKSGGFVVEATKADKYQITLFNSKSTGSPVYLGLYNPTTQKTTANDTSTALSLTLMNPLLIYTNQSQREEYLKAVQQNEKFSDLLAILRTAYQTDSETALDYEVNPKVYELVAELIVETMESFSSLEKASTDFNLQKSTKGLFAPPYIEDAPGDNITVINPKHVYFIGGVYPNYEKLLGDKFVIDRTKSVLSVPDLTTIFSFDWSWDMFVTDRARTNYGLKDGYYKIQMTKEMDFTKIGLWRDDPIGEATLYNTSTSILYIIKILIGELKWADPITMLNPRFKIKLTDKRIEQLGQDFLLHKEVDFLIHFAGFIADNAEGIGLWIWLGVQKSGTREFLAKLAPVLANVNVAVKAVKETVGAINTTGPFIWNLLEKPHEYTFYITQEDGVLTYIDNNLPPNAPTNPSPPNKSTDISQVTDLDWHCNDPDGDPIVYDVYFGISSSPPKVNNNQISRTYNPGVLQPSTKYYWKIVAKDDHNHLTSSPIWSFTIGDCTPPNKPLLNYPINNSSGISTNPTLKWHSASGATSYALIIDNNSNFSSPILTISGIKDIQESISSLSENTKYYWKVKANNSCGDGAWSNVWNFTTKSSATKPSVTTIDATSIGQTSATLNGAVTNDGGATVTERGFAYWDAQETIYERVTVSGTSDTFYKTIYGLQANTKYYFRAFAANSEGLTVGSDKSFTTTSNATQPPAPTLVSPSSNSDGVSTNPNLDWNNVSGADKYHLIVYKDNSIFKQFDNLTSSQKQVTGLSDCTNYTWKVRAHNSAGWGNWSSTWSFKTTGCIGPPPAPGLVSPGNGYDNVPTNPTLDWNNISGADKYHLIIYKDNSIFKQFDNLTSSQKQVTGLSDCTNYTWKVRTHNSAGWGSWSSTWSFKTTGCTSQPPAPTLVAPSNDSNVSTNPTLHWNSISGVDKYQVRVYAGSSIVHDSEPTSSSKSVSLNDCTDYTWKVRAYNSAGWGNWSYTWSFKTIGCTSQPPAPTLVSPSNNSDGVSTNPNLEWNSISGVDKYQVQVFVGSSKVHDSEPTSSNKSVNLSDCTDYTWKVRAYNSAGWGNWSSTWAFKTIGCATQPPAPTLVSPSNNSDGVSTNPNLDWNSISGVDKYQVRVYAGSSIVHDSEPTSSSKSVSLNDCTDYTWKVRAYNSAGWGNWSYTWSFKTTGCQVKVPLIDEVVDTDVHDGSGGGSGNSDGKIDVGEEIDLEVEIKNNGNGTAYNIVGILSFAESSDANYCNITDNTETISSLGIGQTIELDDFDFDVTGMPPDGKLDFKLVVTYADDLGYDYSNTMQNGYLDLTVYESSASKPSVVTNNATNITSNSAKLRGNVTDDGGASIIERGFVYWDIDATHGGNVKVSGTTGSYSKNITGLQPNTLYQFTASAENSEGYVVGDILSFTTQIASGGSIAPTDGCAASPIMQVNTVYIVDNLNTGNFTYWVPIDGESSGGGNVQGFYLSFKVPSNWSANHKVKIYDVSSNFNPVFGIKGQCDWGYEPNSDGNDYVNDSGSGNSEISSANISGSDYSGNTDNIYHIRIYHYYGSESPTVSFKIIVE